MASRILGMGDVVSLVEKAQETIDQDEAARLAEKMSRSTFDLNDFLKQMQQVKKMGSLGSIISMLPEAGNIEVGDKEEKKMARTEAIILSMTPKERAMPAHEGQPPQAGGRWLRRHGTGRQCTSEAV